MTVPPKMRGMVRKVSDMVREMMPRQRQIFSPEEMDLAIHLRGNEVLYESIKSVIEAQIRGRDNLPVPSDPIQCKARLDRNSELRWLLSRLEYIYRSSVAEVVEDNSEQPAA